MDAALLDLVRVFQRLGFETTGKPEDWVVSQSETLPIIAALTLYFFENIRVLITLDEKQFSGDDWSSASVIDAIVTALVVMDGSDLIGRIVAISSIGDVGASAASGETSDRNKPIEIVGRLVVENEGVGQLELNVPNAELETA